MPDALDAFRFYREVLRLNGGQFEGRPFELHESQQFIVGSLFGWKGSDGFRRFRVAYIEEGKGNGKSPMVAGIGLKMLVADGEERAEVYAAATKKDQAMILFRDAIAMVDQSPELSVALKRAGGSGREWNIADESTASFFRPISSDDAQSGPRPHCALLDEVHEHRTGLMIEMMHAGRKWRRQPLIVMITNSGADRQSVCWEKHEYGVQVAAGAREDDTFFSYICALDDAHVETFDIDVSLARMRQSCTCQNDAKTIQIDRFSPEDSVRVVTPLTNGEEILSPGRGVRTIQIEQLWREVCATTATSASYTRKTQSTSESVSSSPKTGLSETASELPRIKSSGRMPSQAIGNKWLEHSGSASSGLRQSSTTRSLSGKVAGVAYAESSRSASVLITAMLQESCGGSYVTHAILQSACSVIVSSIFNAHSSTCGVRQHKLKDGKLSFSFPADEPFTDPSCWIKANPLLGSVIPPAYLESAVREARGMPSKESLVRRLNFCQWVEALNPWLEPSRLREVVDPYDEELLVGRRCYGGLDMSSTADLTAFVLLFEPTDSDPKWRLRSWFWLPQATFDSPERMKQYPIHLSAWKAAGWVEATPGSAVNKMHVLAKLVGCCARFEVQSIGYDRWRIEDLKTMAADEGVSLPLEPFGQGFKDMAPAVDEFERMLVADELRLDGNPVINWNLGNSVTAMDPAGNRKLDKEKATGRIDGAVSAVMAAGRALAGRTKTPDYAVFFVGA